MSRAKDKRRRDSYAGYDDVLPLIREWRKKGVAFKQIAAELNAKGFRTRRGKRWYGIQVRLLCQQFAKDAMKAGAAKAGQVAAAAHKRDCDLAYAEVRPIIQQLRESGWSYRRIAGELSRRGFDSRRGKKWNGTQVRVICLRYGIERWCTPADVPDMLGEMDANDLTREQAEQLKASIGPMLGYFSRLRDRMTKAGSRRKTNCLRKSSELSRFCSPFISNFTTSRAKVA